MDMAPPHGRPSAQEESDDDESSVSQGHGRTKRQRELSNSGSRKRSRRELPQQAQQQAGENLIDLTSEEDSNIPASTPEVMITDLRTPLQFARFPFLVAHTLFHHIANPSARRVPDPNTFEDLSGGYWQRRRHRLHKSSGGPEVLDLVESDDEGEPSATSVSAAPEALQQPEQPTGDSTESQPNENGRALSQAFQSVKCTVCLSPISDITATVCGHLFCEGCIMQAIKAQGKCPICRRSLTERCIHPLFV